MKKIEQNWQLLKQSGILKIIKLILIVFFILKLVNEIGQNY